MDRSEFIKQCGFACLGAVGISALVQSCTSTRAVNVLVKDNRLIVPLSAFIIKTKGIAQYKNYIVVRNERLNYPLVVYRDSELAYSTLLLRCSHQYNELNVNGDILTCPAHGSEFDTKGNVLKGPAEEMLRSFPTTIDNLNLYIQLA